MAIHNIYEEHRQQNMKEALNKFKEDNKNVPEKIYLIMAITDLEEKLGKQEKELQGYRNFFSTLKNFLPSSFTSQTRIG